MSSQQCLHSAICIYENTIVRDNSKKFVAVCNLIFCTSLGFLLLKKLFSLPSWKIKLCYFYGVLLLISVMVCCYFPEGSPRWDLGLRHQLFKQVERLSLIFASGAHNRKMEQAGNWFSIKEASFSLAQFHVQPLINIYCSHRSQQQQVRNCLD